jgi:hypothetical protein
VTYIVDPDGKIETREVGYHLNFFFQDDSQIEIGINPTLENVKVPFMISNANNIYIYSFSTNMFLKALVQYNSDAHQWSSNISFNIIHHPLSDFFLVYNEQRDELSGDLIDRAVIAKFTYMFAR